MKSRIRGLRPSNEECINTGPDMTFEALSDA